MAQKGFDTSQSLLYLGVSFMGPVVGTLAAAPLAARVSRREMLIACSIGVAALTLLFGMLRSFVLLTLVGTALTTFAASLSLSFCFRRLSGFLQFIAPARARSVGR
jgi:putative MFS transporter